MAYAHRKIATAALYGAPLCPAGHLPLKGGDQTSRRLSPIIDIAGCAAGPKLPISPRAGEMSGRTEGGASRRLSPLAGRTSP
ncbi:hypothetical protein FJ957_18280 [Mesorhizobium sp. B2-4-6]|nr:hypothetical protein FJ957_18280 [Mesorhizobium sp. B2-4-6]